MTVFWRGFKAGKCLIKETEPGVQLVFAGPDAAKFEQIERPRKGKQVDFELTLADMVRFGAMPRDYDLSVDLTVD